MKLYAIANGLVPANRGLNSQSPHRKSFCAAAANINFSVDKNNLSTISEDKWNLPAEFSNILCTSNRVAVKFQVRNRTQTTFCGVDWWHTSTNNPFPSLASFFPFLNLFSLSPLNLISVNITLLIITLI